MVDKGGVEKKKTTVQEGVGPKTQGKEQGGEMVLMTKTRNQQIETSTMP